MHGNADRIGVGLVFAIHHQAIEEAIVPDDRGAVCRDADAIGIPVRVTNTIMHSKDERVELARQCLGFLDRLNS